jgi:hypothetical protein
VKTFDARLDSARKIKGITHAEIKFDFKIFEFKQACSLIRTQIHKFCQSPQK